MPKNRALTKSQQDNIRNTLARRGSAIAARLGKHAEGQEEMTSSQIKAAQIILAKIIPDLQSTQFEDVTPQHGQVEDVKQAMADLKLAALDEYTPDQLEAIAESKRANLAS